MGLVSALFLLVGYSFQSATGSAYYSQIFQNQATVAPSPVVLQGGNAGVSTIYENSTSAKVTVGALNWLSGWSKRVKITVNGSDIDATLIDFPVLIRLSNSSSGEDDEDVSFVFDELLSDVNRRKIAVTTSDGTTQCYVEIERWDHAREQAWLWVKAPQVSNTTDTVLYLYYDAGQPDNTAYVGDPSSAPAKHVWDASYGTVHHMEEDPSANITDSTAKDINMTSAGGMTSSSLVEGKIGKGVYFDGADDHYDAYPNQVAVHRFTFEAWIWIGPNNDFWRTIFSVGGGFGDEWRDFALVDRILTVDDGASNSFGTALTAGTWYYVSTTHDGSVNRGYIDGNEQSQNYSESWGSITHNFTISEWGGQYDYFDGILDEIRISNISRSAAWIKASYESGRDELLDFGSEERNTQDSVDNNTSEVGSPSDRGTHSNFTAQRYGPDLIYDTLMEENTATGSIVYENSAQSYSATGRSSHSSSYALQKGSGNERLVVVTVSWEDAQASATVTSLTLGGTAMTKIADVTVGTGYSEYISLWYLLDSDLPSNPGSYTVAVVVSESITREIYMAVAEYSGVKQTAPDDYATHANPASGNTAVTLAAAADGSLVVAGVGEGGTNALMNTNNIDNLQLRLLTSSGSALGHHTDVASGNITVGWNNLSTREGMVGAVWQPSHTNYELDLEVQWTDASYTQACEELCIRMGPTDAEALRVDVWNGSAWINVFSNLAPNTWNNVSVVSYLTSSSFTIRFKADNEVNDRAQDAWNIDVTLLCVWTPFEITHDYVLRVTNTVIDPWQVRLAGYASSGTSRLNHCTINLYNSTGGASSQIVIENGVFTREAGSWFPLESSATVYVVVSIEANGTGTSCIYTYLEALIPNTTTYAQLAITFNIT